MPTKAKTKVKKKKKSPKASTASKKTSSKSKSIKATSKKKKKKTTSKTKKKQTSYLRAPPPPSSRRRRSHRDEYDSVSSQSDDGSTFLHSNDDIEQSFSSSNNSAVMYRKNNNRTNNNTNHHHDHDNRSRVREVLASRRRPSPEMESSSPLLRVISGQKKATAIAQAATWEATRLREQVTTMEKRFLTVSNQLKESMQREQSLKMGRNRDKLTTKELRYRNLYLAKELAQVKDLAKEASAKTRAKMHGMANSLNTVEEAMGSRTRGVQREVRHLRGLLTSLQRRAVRGQGPAGFSSGERILTAMWQAIETIYQIGVPGGSPIQSRVSSRRPYFTSEPNLNAQQQQQDGHGVSTTEKNCSSSNSTKEIEIDSTHDLAETMDGIVSDLERENQRLRAEVEMLQTEIVHYKGKTESLAHIPQYRQAVIRARQHAELLRQRLREEIQARNQIQEQLERTQEQHHQNLARTASQTKRTLETEKELAVTHLRTAYATQAMDSTKQNYRDAYSEFASTNMKQQQVIDGLQDVVTAQRHHIEELNVVPSTSDTRNVRNTTNTRNTRNMGRGIAASMAPAAPATTAASSIPSVPVDHFLASSDEENYDFEESGNGNEATVEGSLGVLHSDLAKLDAEIGLLQKQIVDVM